MVLFVLAMRVMGAGRCRGVRNQVFAFNWGLGLPTVSIVGPFLV